jgi:subtilase family serine protease
MTETAAHFIAATPEKAGVKGGLRRRRRLPLDAKANASNAGAVGDTGISVGVFVNPTD